MLDTSKFKKILSGKDIMEDVYCFMCPDGSKVFTDRYDRIDFNQDTSCLEIYMKDSKGTQFLYEILDIEIIIGIQFKHEQPNVIMNEIVKNRVTTY